MRQDEVSNSIGAHDGVRIAIVRFDEPRVLLSYKVPRFLICPELDDHRIDSAKTLSSTFKVSAPDRNKNNHKRTLYS